MATQTVISQTPPPVSGPGAYFTRNKYNTLIWDHGRRVIKETALQCPCKGDSANQLSDCQNCGGSGWLFINPTETRMIVKKVDVVNKYKDWSEISTGLVNISCIDTEEVCENDRLTLLDAMSIFLEVLKFRTIGTGLSAITFAYTTYNVKKPIYASYFVDSTHKLVQIFYGSDYTINDNQFILLNADLIAIEKLSITVRYFHTPQYHIIEMNRETMQSWEGDPGKDLINLPVAATAKRAHYILNAQNLSSDRILDNSFSVCSANYVIRISDYGGSQNIIVTPPPIGVIPSISVDFTNQTFLTVFHGYGRLPICKVYDIDGDEIEVEVAATLTTVTITMNTALSGTLVIE